MRPGQNKRSRGRNGGGGGSGGGGGGGNMQQHGGNRPRLPQRIQTFDSNGPNVKIRGNAYQVFERYLSLAREAHSSGDRVAAENFYQHAEHYFRMMNAAGEGAQGQPRPNNPADVEMSQGDGDGDEGEQPRVQQINAPQMNVQQMNAPQPQISHEEYRREADGSAAAEREADADNDEDRLPSFLTGRPD